MGVQEGVNYGRYDFREFVDTLVVTLRDMEKAEAPIGHSHPVIVRENQLATVESEQE